MKRRRHPRNTSARRDPAPGEATDSAQRLQKVLAAAGIGSRRQCEELIRTGRVEVDRKVVTELGTRVDPARCEIRVDGTALGRAELAYYALHKPPGVVSTSRDPSGRIRVIDLVPAGDLRLFAVGRLDLHSEGLILVTNDGELANRLTHPRFGVPKTYRVLVAGRTTQEVVEKLLRGIHLAEGMARVRRVTVRRQQKLSTLLEMVLDEGQNREIRRVLARVGHKVLRLMRIAVGPVRLGTLPPGAHRRLSRQEVDALWRAVRGQTSRPAKGPTKGHAKGHAKGQTKGHAKGPTKGQTKGQTKGRDVRAR